ncbi:MAG: phenylalanine--tRNA ligase subunit alpha [Acidobacteriota bacterium]
MKSKLLKFKKAFQAELEAVVDLRYLAELKNKYLSRKRGLLTIALKEVPLLPVEERPEVGKLANEVKGFMEKELNLHQRKLEAEEEVRRIREAQVDITIPGRLPPLGCFHPIMLVREEIEKIFLELGYTIEDGPDIETDYYNFVALNFPKDHPARDSQATFLINEELLLRTQTSPVQVRVMEKREPPIRIIVPGRCFRRDWDITHTPNFFQMEGLVVDEGITLGDLKGTLEYFVRKLFGKETRARFRPSFFPFTEPSADLDISCFHCGGKGCRLCKNSGWIEILGAGMVHPNVFKVVGYDTEKYSGFAWGLGIDRVALILYQIEDARLFYENDLRFLQQFREII